ncbi:MAG: Hsp20 family protein [Actinobacteria bacterium]|nr:Hsp20 family protein [Actinomycetota bacterium]
MFNCTDKFQQYDRRSFRLPKEVRADKAQAKFKDGVLEIKIPETEEAKKRKKKLNIE